ncbi:MAG: S26 family signal peptidase [Chloroflexi bacterium]|nr:S26 family signal peptidase [Chloroflexota bacterium]
MFRIIRISGESLSPEYQEGDFAVVAASPFFLSRLKAGDVIVFAHPDYGTLIKRVSQALPGAVFVRGSRAESVDSRTFGPIPRPAITGKVVWHIRKARRER